MTRLPATNDREGQELSSVETCFKLYLFDDVEDGQQGPALLDFFPLCVFIRSLTSSSSPSSASLSRSR
eukprot:COSAG01_NODE_70915_length_257_cov_0.955696_1_plen_67_part_10